MAQPIPSTSASRLFDLVSKKSGIPKVLITRSLAASLISAYSLKKIIIPAIRKYQKNTPARKEMKEASTNVCNEDEQDDESLLAAANLVASDKEEGTSSTAAVDKQFFIRLWRLLKIMLPGIWTVEAGLLCTHTLTLIARTVLSIHVALLEGILI
jgi:hypothetical protein